MTILDETHDPGAHSWVASAQLAGADFPLQNLPFAVFRRAGSDEPFRGGVAIGDQVLDLARAHAGGHFRGDAERAAAAAAQGELNELMALGRPAWRALRRALFDLLVETSPTRDALRDCLVAQSAVQYRVPARIGDYTDMYTSVHHATNVGRLFRPDNPLPPNFRWLPIGYHGRVSSIGVSGQDFHRPRGQSLPAGAQAPQFGPCQRLDYELELGIWIGAGNAQGVPIPLDEAEDHVFGLCLLNDWSARDIQAWEYQPLGPFLAKSFATTISPWIVTLDALAPFRCPWTRAVDEPQPLAYLDSPGNRAGGGFDLQLEALIETAAMRAAGTAPARLSQTNFSHSYWNVAQMIAHHTVGGCNLNAGDLIGSGTQSGPTAEEAGALIELSVGGTQPVKLPGGETRDFLADGDRVILRAGAERPTAVRIGFGDCSASVLPAI